MRPAATAAVTETTGPPPRKTPTAAAITIHATVTAQRGNAWPSETMVAIRDRAR